MRCKWGEGHKKDLVRELPETPVTSLKDENELFANHDQH